MEMMRKDASFFMEYACTKKNKVPQEFQDFSSPNSI